MLAVGRRSLSEQTLRRTTTPDGLVGGKSEWMNSGDDPQLSPTIFLIDQPPSMALPAHFHHNNQFQLFVEGGGRIGARKLTPVTVHYAGAYTAYGPLVAGDAGLKYLTIRTVLEAGGVMVSKSDGLWPEGPRRHATSEALPPVSALELRSNSEVLTKDLFSPQDDGLAAKSIMVPPRQRIDAPQRTAGEGVFLVVLSGALIHAGEELKEWESLYLSEGETFPDISAGETGVHLLELFPPIKDPAYAHS